MSNKEKAFTWMNDLIAWRSSEPERISGDFWECNSGSACSKEILLCYLPKLAAIIGYPYIKQKTNAGNIEIYFFYKGWKFHDYL